MTSIYCDGAGWNYANCALCVISNDFTYEGKSKQLEVIYESIPSEQLEYMAVIKALKTLDSITKKKLKKVAVTIYNDNQQVINELNLLHLPSTSTSKLHQEAHKLAIELKDAGKPVIFQWIPRSQNLAGIYLEKRLKKIHCYANASTRSRPPTKKAKHNRKRKPW